MMDFIVERIIPFYTVGLLIISTGIQVLMLYCLYYGIRVRERPVERNKECKDCFYGVRKWDLIGSPPKYVYRPNIFCKRYPDKTTEHGPYDWCGEGRFSRKRKKNG